MFNKCHQDKVIFQNDCYPPPPLKASLNPKETPHPLGTLPQAITPLHSLGNLSLSDSLPLLKLPTIDVAIMHTSASSSVPNDPIAHIGTHTSIDLRDQVGTWELLQTLSPTEQSLLCNTISAYYSNFDTSTCLDIGSGSFKQVLPLTPDKTSQGRAQTRFALVTPKEATERSADLFMAEMTLLKELDNQHCSIVKTIGPVFTRNGKPAIILEFIPNALDLDMKAIGQTPTLTELILKAMVSKYPGPLSTNEFGLTRIQSSSAAIQTHFQNHFNPSIATKILNDLKNIRTFAHKISDLQILVHENGAKLIDPLPNLDLPDRILETHFEESTLQQQSLAGLSTAIHILESILNATSTGLPRISQRSSKPNSSNASSLFRSLLNRKIDT